MNAKREFAATPEATATPDFLQNMASKAAGPHAAAQPPQAAKQIEQEQEGREARPIFRERESTQRMTVNMPKGLYEEMRAYMKLTDIPMSEILIDGARRELARLKKQGGE